MPWEPTDMIEGDMPTSLDKIRYDAILLHQIMNINRAKSIGAINEYMAGVAMLEDNLYPYWYDDKKYISALETKQNELKVNGNKIKPEFKKNYEQNASIEYTQEKFRQLMVIMKKRGFISHSGRVFGGST